MRASKLKDENIKSIVVERFLRCDAILKKDKIQGIADALSLTYWQVNNILSKQELLGYYTEKQLSKRERQEQKEKIIKLYSQGLTQRQIMKELGLTERTVTYVISRETVQCVRAFQLSSFSCKYVVKNDSRGALYCGRRCGDGKLCKEHKEQTRTDKIANIKKALDG